MVDTLSSLLRWLDLGGAGVALGAWLLVALVRRQDSAARLDEDAHGVARAAALARAALAVSIVAAIAGHALRAATAADVAPSQLDPAVLRAFTIDTHAGRVWALRGLLLVLAFGLAWAARPRAATRDREHDRSPRVAMTTIAVLALLVTAQALTAAAGHAIAADEPAVAVTVHAVHVVAASVWIGGLGLLALAAIRPAGTPAVPTLLRVFSPIAMGAMAVIVATGVFDAVEQLDRWPPLFGTTFGHVLLLKLALLGLALGCAARLRWYWLPRLHEAPAAAAAPMRWLALEAAAGIAVLACASRLAALKPGRHDAVVWPLPYRLAWDTTLTQPLLTEAIWTGVGIIACGLAVAALLWRRRARAWSVLPVAASLAAAAAVSLPKLAIDAHPDTYRASSVAYEPLSIANGRRLYLAHCTACHGDDADGRGALAPKLAKPPADLTAPHASDHTPGDLYRWITDGMPGGVMPGFGDRLSIDDRWDLVNHLHTLAAGYKARVIRPRIAPRNPWLGAPAFPFETRDGRRGSLRDFRERSAVLLVFDRGAASLPRLRRLEAMQPALRAAGATVLRMPIDEGGDAAPGSASALAIAIDIDITIDTLRTDPDVVFAYLQFRRTLERLRAGESGPLPTHVEFLIDRFGFLRARWLPEDTQPGWDDAQALLEQVRALAAEPRLRAPPDDHLH